MGFSQNETTILPPSVLAIDPGTEQSGYVILDRHGSPRESGVLANEDMLAVVETTGAPHLAIEVFEARGMPIGRDSIDTILWTGRFIQAWAGRPGVGGWDAVPRQQVKLHLCGSTRAKDANVAQALRDRYPRSGGGVKPEVGTSKKPGPLYGIKSHAWAALGVGCYWQDMQVQQQEKN